MNMEQVLKWDLFHDDYDDLSNGYSSRERECSLEAFRNLFL